MTKPHPANLDGWRIAWGEQLDTRPVRVSGAEAITDMQVAGYLAKYATKSTDATGHVSKRITENSILTYAFLLVVAFACILWQSAASRRGPVHPRLPRYSGASCVVAGVGFEPT